MVVPFVSVEQILQLIQDTFPGVGIGEAEGAAVSVVKLCLTGGVRPLEGDGNVDGFGNPAGRSQAFFTPS